MLTNSSHLKKSTLDIYGRRVKFPLLYNEIK